MGQEGRPKKSKSLKDAHWVNEMNGYKQIRGSKHQKQKNRSELLYSGAKKTNKQKKTLRQHWERKVSVTNSERERRRVKGRVSEQKAAIVCPQKTEVRVCV